MFFGFLAAFFIIGCFFVVAIALGITFLVLGLKKKRSPDPYARRHYKLLMAIGIILLAVPAGIVLFIAVYAGVYKFLLETDRKNYNNVMDKWRNKREYIYEEKADDDAIGILLEAADSDDKELMMDAFAEAKRNDPTFQEELDSFFEVCPDGLSDGELEQIYLETTNNYMNGEAAYLCTVGEEQYNIYIKYHFNDDTNIDRVGITQCHIYNLQANAYYDTESDQRLLSCDIIEDDELDQLVGENVTVKTVNGYGAAFYDKQPRNIIPDEFHDLFRKSYPHSYDSLYEIAGTPDGIRMASNNKHFYVYYQLKSYDYEPLYAVVCIKGGEVSELTFCTDKEQLEENEVL